MRVIILILKDLDGILDVNLSVVFLNDLCINTEKNLEASDGKRPG